MSKSGIDTRSGLRKRSNSRPKRSGSRSVMVSAQATSEPAPEPRPGPTGMPLRLGPFDEVGDDQEVARKLHPVDDIELEGKPLAIGLRVVARRHAMLREPLRETRLGLAPRAPRLRPRRMLRRLVPSTKGGRIGCALARPEGAAARDLDACWRWLRADRRTAAAISSPRLEAVLGREPAAVAPRRHQLPSAMQSSASCASIIVAAGEIGLVGRDERQVGRRRRDRAARLGRASSGSPCRCSST